MQSELVTASGIILFGALMCALLILVNASAIGSYLQIMDHPDANRKRHVQVTPLVGGPAIILPVILWSTATLLWSHGADPRLELAILLCGSGATLVGFADDQSSTSPSSRLLSLCLLTSIALIVDPDLLPHQLNWGSFAPLPLAPWFAFGFVVIAMTGYVNAVNMADGQNGIVTGMYAIWALCLTLVTGGVTQSAALVLLETSLVVFTFNMAGRVFLGDSGTYGVTFVFGLLVIRAHNHWGVSPETITVWFFIPVLDCIRLIVTRLLQGKPPSNGDRDHLHHRLEDRVGKSYGLMIYLGVVGGSSLVSSLYPHLALLCMIGLAAFYFSFAWLAAAESAEQDAEAGDVVPLQVRRMENSNVVVLETKEHSTDRP